MRQFRADYLEHTRRGMWEDRSALSGLDFPGRELVLDVGCGTGVLTRVLRDESTAPVVGLDADRDLLERVSPPTVLGDARRMPFAEDAFDLAVCQALLINLPDPVAAVREFARVSRDLVAVVEPDNAEVEVDSSVDAETSLASRARSAYVEGIDVDVALGADAAGLFREASFDAVSATRHVLGQTVEPPYRERDYVAAAKKARGDRLAEQRETLLAGGMSPGEYDEFRSAWREMGRDVVEQMREERYVRKETVPFYVTVARVPSTDDPNRQ